MTCHRVRRSLSSYCDDRLSARERQDIASHLAGCRECASRSEQLWQLRAALRGLAVMMPPAELATGLSVVASRERARRLERVGHGGWLGHWALRVRRSVDHMMRPVAFQFAGGLISAIVLFGMLFPTFAPRVKSAIQDVPTSLSTEATFISMGPFGIGYDDVVVDLTLDQQGRMIDYSTPMGQMWVKDPEMRKIVENALLFTEFKPGTTFGQPASGRVRVTFRRTFVDVKG